MHVIARVAPLALALTVLAAPAAAQPSASAVFKVAFVDSRILMQSAPGRVEAEAQFEKEVTGFRGQMQKMSDSLATLEANYRKVEATLSPAARETRQKDLEKKGTDLQEKARQLEQQMQQRQYELLQPIMDQIRKVLDDTRAADGYAVIFDIGSQGNPMVAYDKNLDITDRIVTKLKTLPAPVAKASTAPAGAPLAAPSGVSRPKPPAR
jgi:outer membrane protein